MKTDTNNMIKNNKIWLFPLHIDFEMVTLYLKKFGKVPSNQKIIFDLSKTNYIHSSFIGFLIDVKYRIEKEGGSLQLLISKELEKIFIKMDLGRFLPYVIVKKSA